MYIDKIYSRKRLKLPNVYNNKGRNNKDNKKIIRIFLILIIAFSVVLNTIRAVNPILERLCIAEAKNIATKISNEETSKVMAEYTYDDLSIVEKTNDGKIQYIKSNIIAINEIASKIAEQIQKSLEENENSKLYIRLGSFTGVKLLSGRGPKIEVVISSVGHIETNLRSEFIDAGVNQTLHRIILDLRCNVTILTPYKEVHTDIENQVILAEDMIIGEIPSSYYNLNGMNKNDSLKIIE